MEKIEYSDLNKFLVSVGIALMTISIFIIWLFFKEPFDLLIEQKTLDNLTETAKTIIVSLKCTPLLGQKFFEIKVVF
jgi:hypothetical protein